MTPLDDLRCSNPLDLSSDTLLLVLKLLEPPELRRVQSTCRAFRLDPAIEQLWRDAVTSRWPSSARLPPAVVEAVGGWGRLFAQRVVAHRVSAPTARAAAQAPTPGDGSLWALVDISVAGAVVASCVFEHAYGATSISDPAELPVSVPTATNSSLAVTMMADFFAHEPLADVELHESYFAWATLHALPVRVTCDVLLERSGRVARILEVDAGSETTLDAPPMQGASSLVRVSLAHCPPARDADLSCSCSHHVLSAMSAFCPSAHAHARAPQEGAALQLWPVVHCWWAFPPRAPGARGGTIRPCFVQLGYASDDESHQLGPIGLEDALERADGEERDGSEVAAADGEIAGDDDTSIAQRVRTIVHAYFAPTPPCDSGHAES